MIDIIYEDEFLLAVNKPSGLLVQGDRTGEISLYDEVKSYLNGGFTGMVHRLDKFVSGIVVFAKSSRSAAALSEIIREGEIGKVYYAIVEGLFHEKSGRLEHYIEKRGMKAVVYSVEKPGSQKSVLDYEVVEERNGKSLLKITLITGRYNQIRAQLAHVRRPIAGDYKYMRSGLQIDSIALIAKDLAFKHPFSGEELRLSVDFPKGWDDFWKPQG